MPAVDRAANLRHPRRRFDSVAGDVADDDGDSPVVEFDDVVPVATDSHAGVGRHVPNGGDQSGQLRGSPEQLVLQ